MVEDWCLGALLKLQLLCLQDVGLHLLQVDIVIEFNDVYLFRLILNFRVQWYLNVDPRNAIGLTKVDLPTARFLQPALVNLFVPVDNVIEFDTLMC